MADELTIGVLIVDTSPLITLAAAHALDLLLLSSARLFVPDAVFYEATVDAAKLGAQELIVWQRLNASRFTIATTAVFSAFQATGERSKSLGELAAFEVMSSEPVLSLGTAIFLYEDNRVGRTVRASDEPVIAMSTYDYLTALERARKIQSADHIWNLVEEAGRHPPRLGLFPEHPDEHQRAVMAVLEAAHRGADLPKV